MSPDEEADDRDGDGRTGDEGVAEDGLASEGGNDFADHTHGRKNHDVNGGVRIEPEKMLEEDGVAAQRGIEETEVEHALEAGEEERNGNDRSAQDEDDAGGVVRPNEERQTEPGHAGGTHGVNGDDEIQTSEDGREAVDKDAEDSGCYGGIRINAAEWRVESPAGVEAAGGEGVENEAAADHVDVPAEEVDLGEGEVLGADHNGNQEIPEDGGDGRDQEEEDHGHAVHGEELIVIFGRDQEAIGRKQVDTNQRSEQATDEEEERNRAKIEQSNALVVGGEKPRTDTVAGVQIVRLRQFMGRGI